MELMETIARLTAANGVSGDEFSVSAIAAQLLEPYVDRVETDHLGNVIGYRSCGKPGAKKLMLDAHLDQIGFVITEVMEEGFCRFIGMGVDQRIDRPDPLWPDHRCGQLHPTPFAEPGGQ